MEDGIMFTALILSIIALLVAGSGIAYMVMNKPSVVDLTGINSGMTKNVNDINTLKNSLTTAQNKLNVLLVDINNIDSDDIEDLEDDVNDVEDDIDDILYCIEHKNNVTDVRECLENRDLI